MIEVNDEIDDTGQEGGKKDNSYYEDFLFQRPMGKVHFTSSINPMHFVNAANPISLIFAVNTSDTSNSSLCQMKKKNPRLYTTDLYNLRAPRAFSTEFEHSN